MERGGRYGVEGKGEGEKRGGERREEGGGRRRGREEERARER